MKRLLLILCICMITPLSAQNKTPTSEKENKKTPLQDPSAFREQFSTYKRLYIEEIKKYGEKEDPKFKNIVNNNFFETETNKIISTIAVGNSALATNGSNFGFSQNKAETTLALNSVIFNKKNSNYYYTAGFNATKTDGKYTIYSNEAWNNKVGLNLGVIKVTNKAVYFTPKQAKALIDKRKSYALKKLDSLYLLGIQQTQELEKYVAIDSRIDYDAFAIESVTKKTGTRYILSEKLNDLKKDLLIEEIVLNNLIAKYKNYTNGDIIKKEKEIHTLKKEITLTENRFIDYNKRNDSIKNTLKAITDVKELLKGDTPKYKVQIKKELTAFDSKNYKVQHYRLDWFKAQFNLANAEYSLQDSILVDLNKTAVKRRTVFDITGSYHINLHGVYKSHYLEMGSHIRAGSYLDNPALSFSNPKVTVFPDIAMNADAQVVDEDDVFIGNYDALEDLSSYMDFFAYYAYFPTKKRNFGISGRFQFNKILKEPDALSNDDSITFMGGILLRNVKEDIFSKGVFGIEAGFENMPEGRKIKDFFTARLTIGIPFEIFQTAKKK